MKYYENHKSFICYRLKRGEQFAASENVAGLLWWWINESNNATFSPALFQQAYHAADLTWDVDGISRFMPLMNKIFIVVCPKFFDNILNHYDECIASEEMSKHDAIRSTVHWLESDKTKNISYFELKHALNHFDTHNIHLIMVESNGENPFLNADRLDVLKNIFGEKFKSLFTTINSSIYFQYNSAVSDAFSGFDWRDKTMHEQSELAAFILNLEKMPGIAKLKSDILSVIPTQSISKSAIDIKMIRDHLKRCSNTIVATSATQQNPDLNFNSTNDEVIYDPVKIRDGNPVTSHPYLAHCMIDAFNKFREKCELPSNSFDYWHVDLNRAIDDSEPLDIGKSDAVSVCAVCFGTLILQHSLKKDSVILSDENMNIEDISATKNASMNLLIALRNPYTKTWPANWVFDNNTIDTEGTANQTSLTLSTILSCDFLSLTENPHVSHRAMKERYKFLWDSVELLINQGRLRKTYRHQRISWGHKIKLHNNVSTSVAFTAFVFDTFVKFRERAITLCEYFKNNRDDYYLKIDADIARLDDVLDWTINYFASIQNSDDGSCKKTDADENTSITHTAYVIKSLYAFLSSINQPHEKAEEILSPAVRYLIEKVEKMKENNQFQARNFERFEVDPDSNNIENIDQYEHCVELIVAETLIKIRERNADYTDRAAECLEWLLYNYINKPHRFKKVDDMIFIRGEQQKLKYPIFYIYYYRMVLTDYRRLKDKEKKAGGKAI
jgi:hypothetical protein